MCLAQNISFPTSICTGYTFALYYILFVNISYYKKGNICKLTVLYWKISIPLCSVLVRRGRWCFDSNQHGQLLSGLKDRDDFGNTYKLTLYIHKVR